MDLSVVHFKSSKKNGKESQGKKKAEEGLMGQKDPGELEDISEINL
jgi:hypothetical protein